MKGKENMLKNIKKILAILVMCFMLINTFAACSKDTDEELPDTSDTTADAADASADDPQVNTSSLKVMSFNVHNVLPSEGGTLTESSQNRLAAVTKEITTYSPDLLGLQEDITAWGNNLSLEGYTAIYDQEVTGSYERCAIYFKSTLNCVDYGWQWLTSDGTKATVALTVSELTDGDGKYDLSADELARLQLTASSADSALRDSCASYIDDDGKTQTTSSFNYLTARRMTYVVVNVDGRNVIYVNTHLQHRSREAVYMSDALAKLRNYERLAQFELVQAKIAELQKTYSDAVVVITGDFNDLYGSDVFKAATAVYNDSYTVAEMTVGQKGSWNAFYSESAHGDNYPNTTATASTETLDYCFVSKDVTVENFRSGLGYATIKLADGTEKTLYTSDHRAIISTLVFETPGTAGNVTVKPAPEYTVGGGDEDDGGEQPGDGAYSNKVALQKVSASQAASTYTGTPDTSWFTGDKTEYTLETADQLMGFAQLSATKNFDGITVKLGANMVINADMNATTLHEWSFAYFCGIFDGQGHYISGMKSARGMFTKASGVICNLSIVNSKVEATEAGVGAVVGETGDSDLSVYNVYVSAAVKSSSIRVGGIVGTATTQATATKLEINGCTFEGTVESTDSSAGQGVGGIIGYVGFNMNVTVESCNVKATVKTPYRMAGGIVGDSEGHTINTGSTASITVKACAVEGSVAAVRGAGGIAGFVYRIGTFTVDSCSVKADVSGTEHIGGLFGRVGNVDKVGVSNCFYKGKVSATASSKGGGAVVGWINYVPDGTYSNIVAVLDGESDVTAVFGFFNNSAAYKPAVTNVWYDSTVYSADTALFESADRVTVTENTVGGKTTAELQSADTVTTLGENWSAVDASYPTPAKIAEGVGAWFAE